MNIAGKEIDFVAMANPTIVPVDGDTIGLKFFDQIIFIQFSLKLKFYDSFYLLN